MSRRAGIDRAPAAPGVALRDVWCHVDLAHLLDEVGRVIRVVGAHGPVPRRRIPPVRTQHRRRRLVFGEPIGDARLRVVRLPIQPGVGIRGRRMRVVLPVVSPEVAAIALGVTVVPLNTLLTW